MRRLVAGLGTLTLGACTLVTDVGRFRIEDAGPSGLDAERLRDAGERRRAYLDRCTQPDECSDGLCIPDLGSTHFCSRPCTGESECASEHVCTRRSMGGRICWPDETLRRGLLDLTEPCELPEQCESNLCVEHRCTRNCGDGLCPTGWACLLSCYPPGLIGDGDGWAHSDSNRDTPRYERGALTG